MQKNNTEGYDLNQSPLYSLKSKNKLASILHINRRELSQLCSSKNLYQEKDIIQGLKPRRIEKPNYKLKKIQKRLANLLQRIKLPHYVYALKKGSSYISNAKRHIESAIVRSIDIEKYFVSTLQKQVYYFFNTNMKCSPDVAYILTKISTFKNHLPTGSPLSPILSFYTHMGTWKEIHDLVFQHNCILTIYVDDLTISGNYVSNKLMWEIKKRLYLAGLRVHPKKEKFYNKRTSRDVTGVIISPNGALKVPNRQHLKIHRYRKLLRVSANVNIKLRQQIHGLESQAQQIINSN